MKKTLVTILILVLVLTSMITILAACKEPTDYDHTIVFYTQQGNDLRNVTDAAIKAFEEKYPGWKVEHTSQGGYDDVRDKIVSDFQGNIQPDLAYCYADHVAQYITTSKVIDLNKFIQASTAKINVKDADGNYVQQTVNVGYTAQEVADFVPGYYAEGYARNFSDYDKYGYQPDDMLTLPFVKSTELLYYNKTALDACGLPVATTWEEIWQQAPTISAKFPKATTLGYDSESNWFITMCQQNGWGYTSADPSNHFLFNDTKQQEWLDKLNEYYEKGWVTTQQDYGSYTSALFTMGAEAGGVIYCVGSSGGASHQSTSNFTWGVAPVPASGTGAGQNAAISQGPSLVMFTGGHDVSNPDEKQIMTWLFVKELLDPTFQAGYAMASGYNPARISSYSNEDYAAFLEGKTIVAEAAKVARTMTDRFFTSPAFVGSSDARTQVGNALVFALKGEKSGSKALRDAYVNCGGIIK